MVREYQLIGTCEVYLRKVSVKRSMIAAPKSLWFECLEVILEVGDK